jgi:peptide/nickel transport system substrate-binding protein
MRCWIATVVAATLLSSGIAHAADLKIGFTVDAVTLDPGNYRARDTETLLRLMYDGLVTHDRSMKVVPELAVSWQQPDKLTYEFTLRRGIKFHDGSELTADDVVFTFTRLMTASAVGGQTSPRKDLLGPLKSVEKVDDQTVRFVLDKPWPVLPAMLTFQEVLNKHFAEQVGSAGLATKENGTGPFRLLEWRRGESLVFERFKDYFGGSTDVLPTGTSCVDHLIVKLIPENASRVAALLAGDVDLINEMPVDAIRQVEANPNTKVAAVNGTRTFFVALNNARPPFNDPRVRQAANYAVNKDLIIQRILRGRATALNGVMSPDAFGFNPDLPAYGYNAAKAKALLADAGHPDGLDVTLDTDGAGKDMAEAIASLLTQVGIRTKVAVGEATQVRAKWLAKGPHDGDMWLSSWGNGSLDPIDIFNPTLHTGGSGNSSGYSNPEVDKLLDAAAIEMDPAKRADAYKQAQVIVNHDAPWIFLWLPQDIYGVSAKLTGFAPSADGKLNLRDACVQ